MLKLTRPDGTPITKYEDWTPPKMAYHWKDDRSAKELAKAWFRPGHLTPPDEFMVLLHSEERFRGLQFISGIPEHVTRLPEKGEGRNHDLWLHGKTLSESVTTCIEAKADEPFGKETVGEYRLSANKRRASGKSTRAPERITKLLSIVPAGDTRWDKVRYQLLTAICGAALQAQKDQSTVAVLVIHEFHTQSTKAEKLEANDDAFQDFLSVLGYPLKSREAPHLYGPFIAGGVDCFVGKIIV